MKNFISAGLLCFVSLVFTASTAYSQQFGFQTFGRGGGFGVGLAPGGVGFGVSSFNRGGGFGGVQFGGFIPMGGYGYGQPRFGGFGGGFGGYEMNPHAIRAQMYRGGGGYYNNHSPYYQPRYYQPQPMYRGYRGW